MTSGDAEQALQAADADLMPLGELIRRTPGAHRIGSIDELRCDAFGTEEELEEFLAFVAESRHGARDRRQQEASRSCWPDSARSLSQIAE